MAQVILIQDNKTLHELLSLNLSTFVGVEVISRSNAQEAIALLELLPNVDLVISQEQTSEEKSAQLLTDYILNDNREINLIVTGKLPIQAKEFGVEVENPKNWEKVIELSTQILGISPKVLQQKIAPDYVPIPLHYFLALDFSCCDVFIRIRKSHDEYQFLKRIHSGERYSKAMVLKYQEQGLKSFFIPQEMQKYFTNFVSDQLVSRLENDSLHPEEEVQILQQAYDIATHEIHKLGFTSATIQLSESLVHKIVETTKQNPEMSQMLHRIINSESHYMYQHCHMSATVGNECLKNLGLDSPENHDKITYAAFFKDIALIDKPELSKITSLKELEEQELSDEDWDIVFNHALEAASLVEQNSEIPVGVGDIIKGHHGAINGRGYSQHDLEKLSKLQQIFFISCEFVKELLSFKETGERPRPIIDEMYKRYEGPALRQVIKALELTLKRRS